MKISNQKHAAVILKCLPRATADRFLAALDADACRNVVHLMKHVEVTTEKLQAAIALLENEGLGGSISLGETHSGVSQGNRNAQVQHASPFEFLSNVDTPILLRLFSEEQSRNAATILSTLPREFASSILKDVAPSKRVEIIRHIASLTESDAKEIADLKFSLKLRIQKLLQEPASIKQVSPEAVASVDEERPYATLHELSDLSNKQIKKLLKSIDTSHLAPALKTLPIQLQRKVLRNMAKKPAAIVSREIVDVRVDEKHRIERSSRSVAKAIKELKET